MKKFTFLVLAVITLLLSLGAGAQQTPTQRTCGTNDWLEAMRREHPGFQAQYDASERKLGEAMIRAAQNQNGQRTQALNVNIPIVFHVVLTAAQQTALTDAMIMAQLTRLNLDFAGLNADSANVPAQFQAIRGHSGIQFCLAQRTPTNTPTNGIVRVTSTTVSSGPSANDPVKSTAAGGSSAWDPTKYFNVWLCNFSNPGLLGYASFPIGSPEDGGWGITQQGVTVLAQSVPGGTAVPFNGGRTLVHEAGHYYWLRHINGDAACGDDFPTTAALDDTPQQSSLTSGCPGQAPNVVTSASGCASAPNPPGRNFQNYMDYTDDACYSMFTKGQILRAEQAINTFRPGYLTSNGCQPLVLVPNDASLSAILTPANNSSIACSPLTPVVTITNAGSNVLTSANIRVELNSVLVGTQAWNGNLASGASANVTLNLVPITPVTGANTLRVYTTDPNGAGNVDGNATNDATTITFTRTTGVALPVVQGFEATTFPPAGWTENPYPANTARKWARFAPGSASGFSIKADFWNWGTGTTFDLTTPYINVAGNAVVNIDFDVAHRQYSTAQDRLQVQVSNNCGASWTTVYDKASSTLGTVTPSTAGAYTPASAADWRKEQISLTGAILTGGPLLIRWVATSNFGNNIWVDNINIDKQYQRDLTVTAITRPGGFECEPFAPVITVKNVGVETITAFDLVTSTGGPATTTPQAVSIAPGASVNVTLPTVTLTAGNYTYTARTNNPVSVSGTGDQNTANDQLTKAFVQRAVGLSPLVEGFEAAGFPSPGWSIVNPNNNITWTRRVPGFGSTYSAFIDNYSTDLTGQQDFIQSPAFSVRGAGGVLADSVIVTWDLAHQNYPGLSDELSVRTSADCGNTFTNVLFARSGPALAGSAGSNTAAYLSPALNHWQHLRAATGAPNLASGHLITTFRNLQGFGNNIFVDNINIEVLFKRDLKVVSVDKPLDIECSGNFTAKATVQNKGIETITAFNISYSIDNGAAQTTNVTGITLARNATMQVDLTPAVANLAAGQHSIKVYSANPVTSSGTGDQLTINDTLTKAFGITGTTAAPLTENFEGSFPPNGWAYSNPDGNITWAKASVGNNSAGSAYMRNYAYSQENRKDELYSPVITYTGVDSVQLSFDLSAITYNYPGTTGIEIDTLEVLITKNCGSSFTSIWKKWGEDLQTVNDPNFPQTMEFVPTSSSQWRNEVIDLTTQFTPNGPIQIVFRNTNNFENNIYVDNVNLKTRTLPATLKAQGYLILPNPFNDQFTIWHLQTPTNLRYVSVYNSAGQLVYKKQYSGDAAKQITVDLTGKAAGTYIVNLGYSDRQRDVQVKVVKL